jgi:hypothetical protein
LGTFLRPRLSSRGFQVLLAPMFPILIWELNFIIALVYQPARLATLPDWVPLVVMANFAYVVAGVLLLLADYRKLQDATRRRKVRLLV